MKNNTSFTRFKAYCRQVNNFLIEHKSPEKLGEYRRIFYSIFSVFIFLFLLWVFGVRHVQVSYNDQFRDFMEEQSQQLQNNQLLYDARLAAMQYRYTIASLDLKSDDSITKYVDPDISFQNIWYVPSDLVPVAGDFVTDSKGYIQIHALAKQNLDLLAEQFYNETQQEIVVVSGYRSYSYQKWIKDRWCPDTLCAKAGHSEHQSGYAVDFYSASTQAEWMGSNTLRKYFDWLNANAHVYGFTNTYRKWVEIDGYQPEPWHWRYVGETLALYLKQHDLTFAEFYYAAYP